MTKPCGHLGQAGEGGLRSPALASLPPLISLPQPASTTNVYRHRPAAVFSSRGGKHPEGGHDEWTWNPQECQTHIRPIRKECVRMLVMIILEIGGSSGQVVGVVTIRGSVADK